MRLCARVLAALAVTASVVVEPSTATAADDDDAYVLAVTGTANVRDRESIARAAELALADAGGAVVAQAPTTAETTKLSACGRHTQPWECVREASTKVVDRVLLVDADVQASRDGTAQTVVTARLISVKSESVIARQRFCEACAGDKLTEVTRTLVRELIGEGARGDGRTLFDLKSSPPGASITIDGERVGVTDLAVRVAPGRHVVVIEKEGFAPSRHDLEVTEGRGQSVSVTLSPLAPGTSPGVDAPPRSRLALAMVSGGAVALGAGVAFLYVGAQDGADDKYLYPRATLIGIGVIVVGAATLGYGIYRWSRPTSSVSTPTAAVSPTGAIVGWARSF